MRWRNTCENHGGSETAYPWHDWTEDRGGQGLLSAAAGGRPDLQTRLDHWADVFGRIAEGRAREAQRETGAETAYRSYDWTDDKESTHSMKKLPPDHPFYKQGFIVGQTFSGSSPKDAQENPAARPASEDKPSSQNQMTEEQIQAELRKVRERGEIPEVVEFMESLMRGLEGKPEGNG